MTCDYDHCQGKPEIENLKTWQKTQNGSLERMAERMDQFVTLTVPAQMDALRADLLHEIGKVRDGAAKTTTWLYRTIIGFLVAILVGLVVYICEGGLG
jgi:hypothetical protein